MICDLFENMELYCKRGDRLYQAISYARDFDLSQPDGEYELEGRDLFAKVMSYETSPGDAREFEAHRDYIDVQVLREGTERMDVSLGERLATSTPYDESKDAVKLVAPASFSSIAVRPGMFVIFFPHDIHRPNCDLDGVSSNRKICMKVHT